MMHVLIGENLIDRDYIERYTLGFEQLEVLREAFVRCADLLQFLLRIVAFAFQDHERARKFVRHFRAATLQLLPNGAMLLKEDVDIDAGASFKEDPKGAVSFSLKAPDGRTFAGWHQDTAYSDVKPIVVIVALALSPARATLSPSAVQLRSAGSAGSVSVPG